MIANYEVCLWLEAKGIQNTAPMGQGGTQTIGDVVITMVNAVHENERRAQAELFANEIAEIGRAHV